MVKSKKQMFLVIGIFTLVLFASGVTYAFFNYTRTGAGNTIRVGRIAFNSSQSGSINLTNAFPITSEEAETDTTNAKSVSITVTGDTDYTGGVEYLVTASDVNLEVNGKQLPVALEISVEGNNSKTLGTEETGDYYTNRENYQVSKYKIEYNGELDEGSHLLVGYIAPNTVSGTAEGIGGVINIKAYIDKDKVLISDTYDGTESEINGTPNSMAAGKTVFTTTEWNSIQNSPLSFKVKVEANEGIWVEESRKLLSEHVISRLGQDGVVAVNTEGDLYTGTGTIREYRYSGIGNYCTYTDGTNNYNISVEGTDCPEHAYKGYDGYIIIGSSDGFSIVGTNTQTELSRVNATATDSGLKNYVMFNNEKWRIIGVFGNNVKIMKDLPLTEDVTNNPVDTAGLNGTIANDNQIYTNTLNEQYLIKYLTFSPSPKYGYFEYNLPGDSNYSYNWNDWTHSGLMYYLNETNTGSYYNTIGASYKSLIDNTTYYLGNVALNEDNNHLWVVDGKAKEVYEQERGNVECAANITTNSHNSNCNIWNGNSATWRGKIGLLYPSDYGYASSSDKWSTNEGAYYYNGGSLNNWMFNTDAAFIWMISPGSFMSNCAIAWDDGGSVLGFDVDSADAVRPVLNLISETEMVDGDGSFANPYILKVE